MHDTDRGVMNEARWYEAVTHCVYLYIMYKLRSSVVWSLRTFIPDVKHEQVAYACTWLVKLSKLMKYTLCVVRGVVVVGMVTCINPWSYSNSE